MEPEDPRTEIMRNVDGVEIKKQFEDQDYDFPSIVYEFTSGRDEEVEIEIKDAIPDAASVDEVGFHRDKGEEHWDVDGQNLIFNYTLEPEEVYETVYAFRSTDSDGAEDLLEPPEAVEVEPSGPSVPGPKNMPRSGSNSTYDGGTRLVRNSDAADEEGAEEIDLDETNQNDEEKAGYNGESVLDKLAKEMEDGDPSTESLETLREYLRTEDASGGSVEARLTQLQSEMSDLRAYKNALEQFLDEEGSANEIISSFERKMDEFEDELETVQEETRELENKLKSVTTTVDSMEDSVNRVSSELSALSDEVESTTSTVETIDDRVPEYSIEEKFADLQDELDDITKFIESLKTAFN